MALTPFEKLQQKIDRKAHNNPKWFGQACIFAPQHFSSRMVQGTTEVNQVEESTEGQDLVIVDELSFNCARDPSLDEGGIDRLEVGDQMYLPESLDPDQRPFAATGEKRSVNSTSWTLVFTRRHVKSRGFDG